MRLRDYLVTMKQGKIKRYPLLFVHLVMSVGILGSFFIYTANLPFLLVARWSPRAWKISGYITQWGLFSLRFFQPWWKGEMQIKLPDAVEKGEQGCLCVANHRSHIDVFLLLEQIRGLRVLTKHLIFWVPGLGFAAFLLRMIRVKRGDQDSFWKAMDQVEKALVEKDKVHVFPEMTRSAFGQKEMARFTLAPFQKAIQTGVPVVPIAIWGSDYLWPKGKFAIARKGPLVIHSLDPVDSTQFSSAAELSDHVKNKLQDKINQMGAAYPYGDFL